VAYGHKRLEAAKRVLGPDYETSIKVLSLTDAQMIQAMATENATGEEESVEARIDVVTMTQKFLVASGAGNQKCPCGLAASKDRRGANSPHEPGSERCLAAFLGWDDHRIHDLFVTAGGGEIGVAGGGSSASA
jgi:hypothetical protein